MHKKKILIADDDRHFRAALKLRLTGWGYVVVESSDGLGVLSQATKECVDALILDHDMPLGDGRRVAHLIRHELDKPIILLSGHDREHFRRTVQSLPDVYYIPKPLDPARLEQLLQSCLSPSRAVPISG